MWYLIKPKVHLEELFPTTSIGKWSLPTPKYTQKLNQKRNNILVTVLLRWGGRVRPPSRKYVYMYMPFAFEVATSA